MIVMVIPMIGLLIFTILWYCNQLLSFTNDADLNNSCWLGLVNMLMSITLVMITVVLSVNIFHSIDIFVRDMTTISNTMVGVTCLESTPLMDTLTRDIIIIMMIVMIAVTIFMMLHVFMKYLKIWFNDDGEGTLCC